MILFLEPRSGIAGDMFLGLLMDLGASVDDVTRAVRAAGGEGVDLRLEKIVKQGISATKATVTLRGKPADEFPESTDHDHHDAHGIGRAEIFERIANAGLSRSAGDKARALFDALFEAEAAVHGKSPEEIHLHEAGAADAVGEAVGAAVALEALGIEQILHASIPWPQGEINIHHGRYPNPSPAAARLLEGRTVHAVDESFELVTPTGAAILAAWGEELPSGFKFKRLRTGYGAGCVELKRANVLRGTLAGMDGAKKIESVMLLETHLDDVTPEILGALIERLMSEGALDAAVSPLFMKKNRPGHSLTVMARPGEEERLARIIFTETGTLGVRFREETRFVSERRVETRETPLGAARFVVSDFGMKPEFEDCRRISLERGLPLKEVIAVLLAAASEKPFA